MPTFGVWKMPISRSGSGLAEAVLQPAVVRLDAGEMRFFVLVLHEREHRALRRVEDLGVDAVLIHDLEPARAAVAAGWISARPDSSACRSARPST
jgi:hypothetical protein